MKFTSKQFGSKVVVSQFESNLVGPRSISLTIELALPAFRQ